MSSVYHHHSPCASACHHFIPCISLLSPSLRLCIFVAITPPPVRPLSWPSSQSFYYSSQCIPQSIPPLSICLPLIPCFPPQTLRWLVPVIPCTLSLLFRGVSLLVVSAHCQLWKRYLHSIGFELSSPWFETAYLPSALPTVEAWPSFDWLWIVRFVIWDCILTQWSPAYCQLWRVDLHLIDFELSASWFETAYLPSEVQRTANFGSLTFIWLALNCPLRDLSLHTYPVKCTANFGSLTFIWFALNCALRDLRLHTYPAKCSVLPTVEAWSSFDWLWIVHHVIWVCVLTQMSSALPSMQAVNFIFSRLFHDSNQRPLALKLSTQPTVLARLRWGCEEYFKYSCHKLICSSPHEKKKM